MPDFTVFRHDFLANGLFKSYLFIILGMKDSFEFTGNGIFCWEQGLSCLVAFYTRH